MTNFVKPASGYENLRIGMGVLATEIISLDLRAYRASDRRTYTLPYSGSGAFNTWLVVITVVNGESIMNFANNVDWGSDCTLIATIVYTKS